MTCEICGIVMKSEIIAVYKIFICADCYEKNLKNDNKELLQKIQEKSKQKE